MLNVVTEFHHLEKNRLQVTVITAMQTNSFKFSMGQFVLEVDGEYSMLKKFDGMKLTRVSVRSDAEIIN